MLRKIALVATLIAPTMLFADNKQSLELEFWQHASTSNNLETVELFIKSFPNSSYMEQAEMLAATLSDDKRRREFEENIFGMVGRVTYETPLSFGSEEIIGFTIGDLVQKSPAFPPVAGLPAEYWEDQSCSNCHEWTREALCTQASTYIEKRPIKYQAKQHPFGGAFKIMLRNWAMGGCE